MLEQLITLIIGFVGGIGVGLQTPLSAIMSGRLGGFSSSFIIHLGGTLLSGVFLLLRGGENIREWRSLPWYMLASGAIGVLLYLSVSYTFPRLGAAGSIILIVIGQLAMGALIDHFGWFGAAVRPLDGTRLLAIGLGLAASYLLVR
jgi:bacterial/archaeal transporter family-2 protein